MIEEATRNGNVNRQQNRNINLNADDVDDEHDHDDDDDDDDDGDGCRCRAYDNRVSLMTQLQPALQPKPPTCNMQRATCNYALLQLWRVSVFACAAQNLTKCNAHFGERDRKKC